MSIPWQSSAEIATGRMALEVSKERRLTTPSFDGNRETNHAPRKASEQRWRRRRRDRREDAGARSCQMGEERPAEKQLVTSRGRNSSACWAVTDNSREKTLSRLTSKGL